MCVSGRMFEVYCLLFSFNCFIVLCGRVCVFVRMFEVNRRRLFCKYVLPYIMYLEEVAIVLYGGQRGDDGDSDSSGSFSSGPAGLQARQLSAQPSTYTQTKSFGKWRAAAPGAAPGRAAASGAQRTTTLGDRTLQNTSMYRRPEPSRIAG